MEPTVPTMATLANRRQWATPTWPSMIRDDNEPITERYFFAPPRQVYFEPLYGTRLATHQNVGVFPKRAGFDNVFLPFFFISSLLVWHWIEMILQWAMSSLLLLQKRKEELCMVSQSQRKLNSLFIRRLLIICGAIGPLLFILLLLAEGATRPGYDAFRQAGSELSLSDQGWMQIINFIVSGLLIVGFAVGVRQTLRQGRGATWGPILLALSGVGLIGAGIFVTDPALGYPPGTPPGPTLHPTLHGNIHFFFGAIFFFCGLSAACFVLARRWATEPAWRGWAIYSVLTGILMVGFFVAFAVAASGQGGLAGLLQRISISIGVAWMVLLALRLLRQAPQSER